MKTTTLGGLLAIAFSLSAHATTIELDLGPVAVHKRPSNEAQIPFASGITTLTGQHLSFDLVFKDGQGIFVFGKGPFNISPVLKFSGAGTIDFHCFDAYTLGQDGQRNNLEDYQPSSGSVTTDEIDIVTLAPGDMFPNVGSIYGFHVDFSIFSNDFHVIDSYLYLGGSGSPTFITGNVPDTGTTVVLLGMGLIAMVLFNLKLHDRILQRAK